MLYVKNESLDTSMLCSPYYVLKKYTLAKPCHVCTSIPIQACERY